MHGYPERPVPRDEDAAKALRKRTLTNLYNARRSGWRMHTRLLTRPWLPRTVGLRTSPPTTLSASCWPSTVAGSERAAMRFGSRGKTC